MTDLGLYNVTGTDPDRQTHNVTDTDPGRQAHNVTDTDPDRQAHNVTDTDTDSDRPTMPPTQIHIQHMDLPVVPNPLPTEVGGAAQSPSAEPGLCPPGMLTQTPAYTSAHPGAAERSC